MTDFEARLAWQAFETQAGPRYRRLGYSWRGSLVGADGSKAASIAGAAWWKWRERRVTIGGRPAYETHGLGLSPLPPALVTDATTGQPVLTSTGLHWHRRDRTRFTFADGRTLTFPVVEGTEEELGLHGVHRRNGVGRQHRFGVMFAVDQSDTAVLIARWGGDYFDHAEVVLCVDATPESLLVALLATPLVRNYFQRYNQGSAV